MAKFYLVGGVFNVAERSHNIYLEKYLTELGDEVVLPQREALKHYNGRQFDTLAIMKDCVKFSTDPEYICVVCGDGARSDDGGSVEYGMTINATGRAIFYRTDIRTAPRKELGVNAMFKAGNTIYIFQPCIFTELGEIEAFYKKLAKKIHKAALQLL
ncbi:MAG: hypothetical protein PHW31_04300 [Candidatus Pacebacteria bacterium]|nr:hypothetical protein [Candidatus Paceibacterota bacterium]